MNIALIVAAGKGTRLNGPIAKQYLPLAGLPVLARAILPFEQSSAVDLIYLVVSADDREICHKQVVVPLALSTPLALVAVGESRQESVHNGLKALPAGDHWVMIHDGVRPFVTAAQIEACLKSATTHGASTLALPAIDTLKQVDPNGLIVRTRQRRDIWLAQTPQTFRLTDIAAAHAEAKNRHHAVTDDAALMEWMGHRVAVVEGSRLNFKITTSEDLELAEAVADMPHKRS